MKAGQWKTFIFMTVELLKKFFDFFAAAQGNMASAEKNGLRLSTLRNDHAGKKISTGNKLIPLRNEWAGKIKRVKRKFIRS
jgi:hypothetical protein